MYNFILIFLKRLNYHLKKTNHLRTKKRFGISVARYNLQIKIKRGGGIVTHVLRLLIKYHLVNSKNQNPSLNIIDVINDVTDGSNFRAKP